MPLKTENQIFADFCTFVNEYMQANGYDWVARQSWQPNKYGFRQNSIYFTWIYGKAVGWSGEKYSLPGDAADPEAVNYYDVTVTQRWEASFQISAYAAENQITTPASITGADIIHDLMLYTFSSIGTRRLMEMGYKPLRPEGVRGGQFLNDSAQLGLVPSFDLTIVSDNEIVLKENAATVDIEVMEVESLPEIIGT
jgi:hypothetical protein